MPDPLSNTSNEDASVLNPSPTTSLLTQDSPEHTTYHTHFLDKSPATLIMHTTVQDKHYCIKLWRSFHDSIYDTRDTTRNNKYTFNGLTFNTQFAPNIYLGVAPIYDEQDTTITLGPIIMPQSQEDFSPGLPHALIMHFIEQHLRLDNQIKAGAFGNREDLQFLAAKISALHTNSDIQYHVIPDQYKNIEALQRKWNFNKQCLTKTLQAKSFPAAGIFEKAQFFTIMDTTLKVYRKRFQERCHYIQRCHGDLKTNNLWLLPNGYTLPQHIPMSRSNDARQLYALDCIDFNPFLYYIDPLSDLAMLVMDLEEKLLLVKGEASTSSLLKDFLTTYHLHTSHSIMPERQDSLDPVLEFYIVEKAIAGAAVSVLSDERPDLGKRYLHIAQTHLKNLSRLLSKTGVRSYYSMTRSLSHQNLSKTKKKYSAQKKHALSRA